MEGSHCELALSRLRADDDSHDDADDHETGDDNAALLLANALLYFDGLLHVLVSSVDVLCGGLHLSRGDSAGCQRGVRLSDYQIIVMRYLLRLELIGAIG